MHAIGFFREQYDSPKPSSSDSFFFWAAIFFALLSALLSTQYLATTPSRKSPKSTKIMAADATGHHDQLSTRMVGMTRAVRKYVIKLAVNQAGTWCASSWERQNRFRAA
jgi:hypothetical protein